MAKVHETDERRTLRDFGFEACEHPIGSIGYEQGKQHCGMCGARRIGTDTWEGGSPDYRIDVIVLDLYREILSGNQK